MNQLNTLYGEEPTDPPREWNSQPQESHIKYRTSTPQTSPLVSDFTRRINHHAINNGDVEVHPSDYPVEYNSKYVTDPDTTSIESIDDDEMDHLLDLFHPEHDDDLLDVELHTLQA